MEKQDDFCREDYEDKSILSGWAKVQTPGTGPKTGPSGDAKLPRTGSGKTTMGSKC